MRGGEEEDIIAIDVVKIDFFRFQARNISKVVYTSISRSTFVSTGSDCPYGASLNPQYS